MTRTMFGLALAAVALAVPEAPAATRYVATRIPFQKFYNTSADGINAAGDIVGNLTESINAYGDEAEVSAFVFTADNEFTPIALPAELAPAGSAFRGAAINSGRVVVGDVRTGIRVRAFRFAGSVASWLLAAGPESSAAAINDAGDVAGTYGGHAFLTNTTGHTTELNQESYATAINLFGEIAGYVLSSRSGLPGAYHAFRFRSGQFEDLGAMTGTYAYPSGINARGDVVGQVGGPDNRSRPFLYGDGVMRRLGEGGGTANAINNAGTVVGSYEFEVGEFRPFVYGDGVLTRLDTLVDGLEGATLVVAAAVNDAGQIAGRACTDDVRVFDCFGVRLDPVPAPVVRAVEFHHAGMDHYFLTADATEIAQLDAGALAGWTRTGERIAVLGGPQAGTAPVCRLFSSAFAPRSSHFYTGDAAECAGVARNPAWQFEGIAFRIATPDSAGGCPAAMTPVYRLYNNGQGDAPNHRFTTSRVVRDEMLVRGWVPEGSGPLGVAMCAPPAG
jgi:probable HAF family extracellular repeat protein